jgi:hypothetical protein
MSNPQEDNLRELEKVLLQSVVDAVSIMRDAKSFYHPEDPSFDLWLKTYESTFDEYLKVLVSYERDRAARKPGP